MGGLGPLLASWFREQLDAAKLTSGDVVFLSSPGGSLDQGLIMGRGGPLSWTDHGGGKGRFQRASSARAVCKRLRVCFRRRQDP